MTDRREAQRADLGLDLLLAAAVFVVGQRQAFLTIADVDVRHAGKALHGVFDLDRTGAAIHSLDAQFEGFVGGHSRTRHDLNNPRTINPVVTTESNL